MYGVIYKITNTINNKIYVGKTTNFKRRCKEYNIKSTKSRHKRYALVYDIVKYGWCNFTMEIIDTAESEDELNNLEIFWISNLNALNPDIGYNKKTGGVGGCLNAESKKLMSESSKNFRHSDETKLKKSVPIIFVHDDQFFYCQSAKVFADMVLLDRTNVTRALKHGYKVRGFYVAYYEKWRRDEIRKKINNKKYIKILDQIDNGVETKDHMFIYINI